MPKSIGDDPNLPLVQIQPGAELTRHRTHPPKFVPLIQYTFTHPEGHDLTETDYFLPSGDYARTVQSLLPAGFTVKTVKVLNPFIHPHNFQRVGKMGERVYYTCPRCGVGAYKRFHLFQGAIGGYTREDQWKSSKFEMCRDPLKEMPPSTKLFR